MDRLAEGKKVFDVEIKALQKMRDALDSTFLSILDLVVNCKGKVIITGMGKPSHIGAKIAATFASLGTQSFFLHPGEAMHGDLGMIGEQDIVIMISYSGESDEIVRILPNIRLLGAKIIAITGNENSTLAKYADIAQILPKFDEACNLGLAPTSSTTVELAYGDALAVVASDIYGFKDVDYGKRHPGGSLGKKLIIKVDEIMSKGEKNATISVNATLKDAIVELSKKGLGMVTILNDNGTMAGIITDGDLRRLLEKGVNVYDLNVKDVMTKSPKSIETGSMAVDALRLLKEKNISCIPIVDKGLPVGTVRIQDILGIGIVG